MEAEEWKRYLGGPDGGADGHGIARHGAAVAALWVGHGPTVLAAEVHLAKLCSSSAWHAKFRLDHLGDRVIVNLLSL